MKRIIAALAGTIIAVALLLTYRTSLNDTVVALPGTAAHVVSGGPTSSTHMTAGAHPQSHSVPDATLSSTSPAVPPAISQADAPSTSTPDSAPTSRTSATTVVDGLTERTPYGPVQVRVIVTAGRISQVTVLQRPNSQQRSQQINAVAIPQLQAETMTAQSAKVDAVSGATYTTEGYVASLQSALDAAHRNA